ncbi:MAG: glycolate oxidase subunit GlcE [Rhodocyclaceae bacterium]|nr:glycolate oxidase subunit GlcE [Rhodocyclaceae bacterium]
MRLADAVRAAGADHRVLHTVGGDSKRGLGGTPRGGTLSAEIRSIGMRSAGILSTLELRGIVDYDPAELVATVRAGTPLADLQDELAAHGQMLPFEPPAWPGATVGGAVASGLAGPRRAFAGAVRDALLGVRLVDGRGQVLQFGGRVMKNVAGFDLFRLQAGAWGRLGVVLEVSFRLLPRPQREKTVALPMPADAAIDHMNRLAGTPLPLSAAAWAGGALYLRLSGSEAGVRAALAGVGGEALPQEAAARLWASAAAMPMEVAGGQACAGEADEGLPLWRLAVPTTTRSLAAEGEVAIDWCGGLRWLRSAAPAAEVRALAASLGGHATAWHGNRARPAMHPLDPVRLALHQRLFAVFDPHGVFDSGRFDADADAAPAAASLPAPSGRAADAACRPASPAV